jgi:addiction module HigA family antidote
MKKLRDAPPVTPGEILVGEFLQPLRITQRDFAKSIDVSPAYVTEIVRGRRGVTPEMALRFEAALGVSARLWLDAQMACDLFAAAHDRKAIQRRRRIRSLRRAAA